MIVDVIVGDASLNCAEQFVIACEYVTIGLNLPADPCHDGG